MRRILILLALLGSAVSPAWAWAWPLPFERVLPTVLAFASDGTLYVGYSDGSLEHIALRPYALLSKIKTYDGAIRNLVMIPDKRWLAMNKRWLATISYKGLSFRDETTLRRVAMIEGRIDEFVLREDGTMMLVRGEHEDDEGWRPPQELSAWTLDAKGVRMLGVCRFPREHRNIEDVSADGRLVFTSTVYLVHHRPATVNGKRCVIEDDYYLGSAWRLDTPTHPRLLCTVKKQMGWWNCFQGTYFTSDGSRLLTYSTPHTSNDRDYYVIDVKTGKYLNEEIPPTIGYWDFDPTGRIGVKVDEDLDSGANTWSISATDFSNPSGIAYNWSRPETVFHDPECPNPQPPETDDPNAIDSIAISPDSKILATAGEDGLCLRSLAFGFVFMKLR